MAARKFHSDSLASALERTRRWTSLLARRVQANLRHADPFAVIAEQHHVERTGDDDLTILLTQLIENSVRLGPLVKRRLLNFHDVPEHVSLGWVQLPALQGNAFALGVFTDRNHFSQIAVADGKGRVFFSTEAGADLHNSQPRFMFVKERADYGDIVGRDPNGRMTWLASWSHSRSGYRLEQMRHKLPQSMREGLEYRDAVAIAFFAAYVLPQMQGALIGFGSGNIFRRLNREAPMGAIRRSVNDMYGARAHGMRVSGLEEHFAELMREAGALDEAPGLEAVHGAEPLHLFTSSYSGRYFFSWDSSLELAPVLRALAIEGNLNRFAMVSAWLERNARLGLKPTEETVTRAQAATIDLHMLDNPALLALGFDEASEPGHSSMWALFDAARRTARDFGPNNSEWGYRQAMSLLVRRLRLPYRFDVAVRSNLAEGRVAVGFTAAGVSMMPSSRYDEQSGLWVELDDRERAVMSAAYNLRVGLMLAMLSFGASDQVREVSLRVDSLGLEEAIAEQDSAIQQMMSEALGAFERMQSGDMGSGRGEPKDGDLHGDPTRTPSSVGDVGDVGDIDNAANEVDAANEANEANEAGSDDAMDRRFEDLVKDIDIDETVFCAPGDVPDGGNDDEDNDDEGDGAAFDDPMNVLRRNPTVRCLATVRFTREKFLSAIAQDGLEHPQDTYRMFNATMDVDGDGALEPITADFDLRDTLFAPSGSQQEPEMADHNFSPQAAQVLGTSNALGLSIQRADLIERADGDFHRLATDATLPRVTKARHAMQIVDTIADPELSEQAPNITSALIDGHDTPAVSLKLSRDLDKERAKVRDLLFSGQADRAIQSGEAALQRLDALFARNNGVPRYFNSYAERVVYNRLFATPGERTVLIPDNLFYAHMELADLLAQVKGAEASLGHLNTAVAYAPAYPLPHLKLAVQLARNEDWSSARAACLNALLVALDRDDAAFAYYRLAYAEWMQERYDTAAAAYIMSDHIAPGQIGSLQGELQELFSRAESQCIAVPVSVAEAAPLLHRKGLPVWPHTEAANIVRDAARLTVDEGLFVPARTLSVAAARMNGDDANGIDVVQAQFIRSLSE